MLKNWLKRRREYNEYEYNERISHRILKYYTFSPKYRRIPILPHFETKGLL